MKRRTKECCVEWLRFGPVTSDLPNRAKFPSDPSLLLCSSSTSSSPSLLLHRRLIASFACPFLFFFFIFIFFLFDASGLLLAVCDTLPQSILTILSLRAFAKKKKKDGKKKRPQVPSPNYTPHTHTTTPSWPPPNISEHSPSQDLSVDSGSAATGLVCASLNLDLA